MHSARGALVRAHKTLTGVNAAVGRLVAWFMPAMTVTVLAIIFFGSAFRLGWVWMGELVAYMHAMLFTAAAAYTLGRDEHVRVDVFYGKMPPRGRALVNLCGVLFLLAPACVVVLVYAWPYVRDSWEVREYSPEGAGLPAVFILKTFILLMPVLLLMQGAAMAIKSCLVLLGIDEDGNPTPSFPRKRESIGTMGETETSGEPTDTITPMDTLDSRFRGNDGGVGSAAVPDTAHPRPPK